MVIDISSISTKSILKIGLYSLILFFLSEIRAKCNANLPTNQNYFFVDRAVKKFPIQNFKKTNDQTFYLISHGRPGELLINGEWKNAEKIAQWLLAFGNWQSATESQQLRANSQQLTANSR